MSDTIMHVAMSMLKALLQVVADMTFEELEAASTAEDALLVAFVKGGQPLVLPCESVSAPPCNVTCVHHRALLRECSLPDHGEECAVLLADKEATSCKDKVAELNKVVAELGPLIKAAQVAVGDTASAQAKQWGVDGDRLGADPCALDIALLPFDEDKGSPDDWQHYAGAQAWSLHAFKQIRFLPMLFSAKALHMLNSCTGFAQWRRICSIPVQSISGPSSILSRASHTAVLCSRRPE